MSICLRVKKVWDFLQVTRLHNSSEFPLVVCFIFIPNQVMNEEQVREYALEKEDVTEGFPFGEDTLVFKTNAKVFMLLSLNEPEPGINLKCDTERAIALRDEYPDAILPGYHMNKKHWNTVKIHGLKNALIKELIDHSYNLVARKKK